MPLAPGDIRLHPAVMFGGRPRTVNLLTPFWLTMRAAAAWRASALRALLPPRCLLCGEAGQWLAIAGAPASTPALALDLCVHCQAALPAAPAPVASATSPSPLAFELCPWRYEYPLNALVRALKFHGDRIPARVLGQLLAAARTDIAATPADIAAQSPVTSAAHNSLPALIVPMPLHARRLRDRGYNQAALIARHAARSLGLPLQERLLVRWRYTREQSGLKAAARRANVAGAFRVQAPLPATHIALVDDVITTGATARAAAAALCAAGATCVELWALARAGRGRSAAISDRRG